MGPGNKPNILQLIAGAEPLGAMRRAYDSAGRTVLLRDMVGGALSVYAAALIARTGGTCPDREYCNDRRLRKIWSDSGSELPEGLYGSDGSDSWIYLADVDW